MYKIYFAWFADDSLLRNVYSVLCENGFLCSENMRGGPEEEIDASDVLLCDAFPENACNYSLWSTREVYHALDIGVPVVVIQKDRYCDYSVGGSLDDLAMRGNSVVFQMREDGNLRNLPAFLNKVIEKKPSKKHFSWFTQSKTPGDSYVGNEEYLYVSFAEKDRLKAYRIIKNMQDKGYRVAYRDQYFSDSIEFNASVIQNCCCLIALISPDYVKSENCRDEISLARDLNKDRLLVYLKKTELSPGMAMRLLRLQAIHKYTYKTEQEFYDKLYLAKGIESAKL